MISIRLMVQWLSCQVPLEVTYFFAAVKSFDTNIAIIGNFVLNAKNSSFIRTERFQCSD